MMSLLRYRATLGLAAVLVLGMMVGYVAPADAAPAAQNPGRIAVVVFPDLAGDGPDAPACPGCDKQFGDEDSAANNTDPLPSVEVILRDDAGAELNRNTTNRLANGRQVTFFSVTDAGDYEVEVVAPGAPWVACPGDSLTRQLTTDDFDASTGIASVDYYMWRGCDGPQATATPEETDETPTPGTEVPTVEATATSETEPTLPPTIAPEPTVVPTDVPDGGDGDDGDGDGADSGDGGEPAQLPADGAGAIQGLVYIDLNGNAQLGPDEPGVPGVVVHLEGGGQLRSQTTSGAGNYSFEGLAPGRYDVFVEVPQGFELTTTNRYSDIEVMNGDIVMGIDFGLVATGAGAATAPPPEQPDDGPSLPSTGVQLRSTSGVLLAVAAVVGVLGALGLVLENRLGRRTLHRKDSDDV